MSGAACLMSGAHDGAHVARRLRARTKHAIARRCIGQEAPLPVSKRGSVCASSAARLLPPPRAVARAQSLPTPSL